MNTARCVALLAALLATAAPALAAPKWLRLTSPHFVVVGDAREGDLRAVARRLEQFREVFIRLLPKANAQAPVPTVVVVFQRDGAFRPYKPVYQGKVQEVAGFFQSGPDVNSVALSLEYADDALPVAFHELAHAILSTTITSVPTWFGEGYAEFFERTDISSDGLQARLGKPAPASLELLRERTNIPVSELLAAEHDSALYRESSRRDVFYAQSWALVHYLMVGSRDRKEQLGEYLDRVGGGASSLDAARAAFGDLGTLQKDLSGYVQRRAFTVVDVRFKTPLAVGDIVAEPLHDAERLGYLAELLVRLERVDEALAQVAGAPRSGPGSARINAAIGLAHLQADRYAEAVTAFRAAVDAAPTDALLRYQLGRSLVLGPAQDEAGGEALEAARAALLEAVSLRPDLPDANALLGHVLLAQAADPKTARPYVARAAELVPANEQYRLTLARLCLAERNPAEARRVAGRIVASSPSPEMKEAAREVLSQAAALERDQRDAAAAAAVPATPEAAPADAAVPRPSDTGGPGTAGSPAATPRPDGEQQALGRWLALDCASDAAVLRIRLADRTAGFWLARPAEGQAAPIFWMRPGMPEQIACGPRAAPEPVRVIWKAIQGTPRGDVAGELVRLEVLPEETAPP